MIANELKCTITVRRMRPAMLILRALRLLVRLRVLTSEEFVELGAAIIATVPRATIFGPGIAQTSLTLHCGTREDFVALLRKAI